MIVIIFCCFECNLFIITSEQLVALYLVSGENGVEDNYSECTYDMAIDSFI